MVPECSSWHLVYSTEFYFESLISLVISSFHCSSGRSVDISEWQMFDTHIQVGPLYARVTFLKNIVQIKNIPWWLRGLTTSSYIVYDYTSSGHTYLYSVYVLYTQYIYIST
jgi:hypothetical protein